MTDKRYTPEVMYGFDLSDPQQLARAKELLINVISELENDNPVFRWDRLVFKGNMAVTMTNPTEYQVSDREITIEARKDK